MPSYELSIEAAADLESIGDYGVTRFGLPQALKYQLALESRFELRVLHARADFKRHFNNMSD